MTQPASTEIIHRALRLDVSDVQTRAEAGEELVELEFAFASETPVDRHFGHEILEVTPKAARLERVAQGVVPLTHVSTLELTHFGGAIVGRVLAVTIGRDRIARARVRFARSEAARECVQGIVDGIFTGVSFGYRIHRMELVGSTEEGDTVRVVDWEPFEITIMPIPADPTVGTHRSFGVEDRAAFRGPLADARRGRRRSTVTMSFKELAELDEHEFEQETRGWPAPKRLKAEEEVRKLHLEQVGKNFRATPEHTARAIERGLDVEGFVQELREIRSRGSEPLGPPPMGLDAERGLSRDALFGLDGRDLREFSLFRAIRALASGRPDEAAFEFEVSDYVRSKDPRREFVGRGLTIPHQALAGIASRAIGKVQPNTTGASLVGVEHMAGAFVNFLSPLLVVLQSGARVISANGPDLSIPRQITGAATTWVDENAGSGEDSPTFDSISMSPKTVRARSDMTRRMLIQSEPQVEGLVASELARSLAQAIDGAALAGPGGVAPEGILTATGVGSVPYVATSGQTERQTFLALQDEVAATDAPMAAPAVLLTTSLRSRLMGLSVDQGSGVFVAQETNDPTEVRIAGIRGLVSNNLPRNLGVGTNEHAAIFADWSELLVALWSTVDIIPDQATLGDSGGLVLRAFQDVDVALRHATSFAVTQVNPAA